MGGELGKSLEQQAQVTQGCQTAGLRIVGLLRPGGEFRAVLRVVEHRGGFAVLKDYSYSRWLFRHTVGAFLAAREACAYRAVAGLQGVPRLLRRVGLHGLLLEYVAGDNCRETETGRCSHAFFEQLGALLQAVRQRGVLHLDVKRNVLRSREGQPFLVDFATAVVLPWWLGSWRDSLLQLAAAYDEQDVAKLKRLVAPDLLTPEDERLMCRRLPLAGLVRFIEQLLQRVVCWCTGQPPRSLQPPAGPIPARNPAGASGDNHATAA